MPTEPPPSTRPDPAPPEGCEVAIQNPNRDATVRVRALRPWVESVLAAVAPTARSFTLRFVSDREMQRLNRTYRARDRPTDVLSFPGDLEDAAQEGTAVVPQEGHLGDVVVSVPTAARQARSRGHDASREIRLLVLHGVLHCLGHDHEQDDGTMDRLERRWRRRFLEPLPTMSRGTS